MENMDILDAIVGEDPNGRYKSTVGFFVEKAGDESEDSLLDEFYVAKPIVEISEYADIEGSLYYSIAFNYKSRRDEDLKQQWQFLERYCTRLADTSEGEEPPVLTVIFLPVGLRDKYSILAKAILPDSMIRIEYASDNSCSIRMLVFKEDVIFLSHDDESVDRRYIEEEVIKEIDASLTEKYGPLEVPEEQ